MHHFFVVVEAVLVSALAGAAFFRGRRWWQYKLLIPTALALVICELAPVVLQASTDAGEVAIAGLLMAQGTLVWVMLRKEQAQRAMLLARIKNMLQDRVRNKLQVVAGSMNDSADVFHAIEEVAHAIDELSDVALTRWEARYSPFRRHPPPAGLEVPRV
jgi:hypothetical protein